MLGLVTWAWAVSLVFWWRILSGIGTGCRRGLRLEQMGVRVVALGLFGESKVVEVVAAAVAFPGVLPRLWGLESAFGIGYAAAVPGLRWVGWAESATGKVAAGLGFRSSTTRYGTALALIPDVMIRRSDR
jgi:hypothetical protein